MTVKKNKLNFWLAAGLLLIISCAIVLPNLGGIALLDPDEPVYGQTAKEMLATGDWLSPRIYGDYWYDKPPMYYWLAAAAFKVGGVSELTARLPAALSALACVLLVFWQVAKVRGILAGLISGLVLVSSLEFFYLAKGAVTDSTLNLFLTAALLAFWRKKYCWSYAFAAVATLTKGPIGLAFPLGIGLLYLCVTRQWKEFRQPGLYGGLLVYAFIAVPWYAAMYQVHGMAFIETFLGFHNLTRFTTAEHPGTNVWYFFPVVFVAGFFPWSLLLPDFIYRMLKARAYKGMTESDGRFFLIWALAILLFFSLSKTKLVSYILPMFPPMAILIGCYLEEWLSDETRTRFWCVPFLMGLVAVAFSWTAPSGIRQMPQLEYGAIGWEILFWSMTVWLLIFVFRRQKKALLAVLVAGMIVFAGVLVLNMMPEVEGAFSCKAFAEAAERQRAPGEPLYVAKFLRPGYTFYSDAKSLELSEASFKRLLTLQEPAYYAVPQSFYERLTVLEKERLAVLLQQDGKMLLHR